MEHNIVNLLPESDRKKATELIENAVAAGWTSIGFCTYDDEPSLDNLVGVHPVSGFLSLITEEHISTSQSYNGPTMLDFFGDLTGREPSGIMKEQKG